MILYHYTCDHCHRELGHRGVLRPCPNPMFQECPPLVWFTDLDTPDAMALGLTSQMLLCDRTKHRYHAHVPAALSWFEFCGAYPNQTKRMRQALHQVGTQPQHWFVSTMPVKARLG